MVLWRRQAHSERTVRKLSGMVVNSNFNSFFSSSFSPDASLVAGKVVMPTGRSDIGKLFIHDTATGKLVHKIPFQLPAGNHAHAWFSRVTFSADSQVVALCFSQPIATEVTNAGNRDCEFQIFAWNLADGRQRFHDREAMNVSSMIPSLSVNSDGSRIAAGWVAFDWSSPARSEVVGSLRVLDCSNGRERLHWVSSSEGCYALEISRDGRLIASSPITRNSPNAVDSSCRLLISEVETGRMRFELTDQKLLRAICLRFSPDGRSFAASTTNTSMEAGLLIVDLATGQQLVSETLQGYGSRAMLTYTPDSRWLVVGSSPGPAAQVRDVRTGKLLQNLSQNFLDRPTWRSVPRIADCCQFMTTTSGNGTFRRRSQPRSTRVRWLRTAES